MTVKELKHYIDYFAEHYPERLDQTVKIEYPNGQGSSDTTEVNTIDFDESDYIVSYYKYV